MRIIKEEIGFNKVELRGYIHDDLTSVCDTYKYRPAIIICPGGAYEHLSAREQDPIALPLFAAGFQVFTLLYSIGKEIKDSEPEAELAEAVAFVKHNSEALNIVSDQIAIMGFSAGGHLVASLCCHWNRYGLDSKPNCGILCYPVITMDEEYGNKKSIDNLTFGVEERVNYFSLENAVDEKTLPCFIWHTTEDEAVPIQNSLLFVNALSKNKIPFEYHVFQEGRHGLAAGMRETGPAEIGVQPWMDLCISWLNRRWQFTL